jgi:hypothetical protein
LWELVLAGSSIKLLCYSNIFLTFKKSRVSSPLTTQEARPFYSYEFRNINYAFGKLWLIVPKKGLWMKSTDGTQLINIDFGISKYLGATKNRVWFYNSDNSLISFSPEGKKMEVISYKILPPDLKNPTPYINKQGKILLLSSSKIFQLYNNAWKLLKELPPVPQGYYSLIKEGWYNLSSSACTPWLIVFFSHRY